MYILNASFGRVKVMGGTSNMQSTNPFFYDTCMVDLNQLHHCLSQKQFDTYAKFVREAWRVAVKEHKIKR